MPWTPQPKNTRALLAEAHAGRLRCTCGKDLKPHYTAEINLTEADRQHIMLLVLRHYLSYENHGGPHGFGDGRLILTSAGLECLRSMPIPGTPKTAKP